MNSRVVFLLVLTGVLLVADVYAYQAFRQVFATEGSWLRKWFPFLYWGLSALLWVLFLGGLFYGEQNLNKAFRNIGGTLFMGVYMGKLFASVFFLIEDLTRLFRWLGSKFFIAKDAATFPERAEFLVQSALVVAAIPVTTMSFGILSGAHDYQVRKVKLKLDRLPSGFRGLKIVQISDVHAGSFWNKKAVIGGVELIMAQKADMVFFTGDLVNNVADEMKGWTSVFDKVKAPLGVYSVLGNHDYGDYVRWNNLEDKSKNLSNLKEIHREMGWNLLNNSNKTIKVGNDMLHVVGVENYGVRGHFAKYGKLDEALNGLEHGTVKLLLSHDPSHWQAQVTSADVDVMFAGHTHGMQFGIETAFFKWSPVQYMYPQWAGLYKEENSQLYVNRGFGYIGYPGRIGILPEITVFELV